MQYNELRPKRQLINGWWVRPPEGLYKDPYAYALFWVKSAAAAIHQGIREYEALLASDPTLPTRAPGLARLRGVLAADRALCEWWCRRARKVGPMRGIEASTVEQGLREAVQGGPAEPGVQEPAVPRVLGPYVDPGYIEGCVRAAGTRTRYPPKQGISW